MDKTLDLDAMPQPFEQYPALASSVELLANSKMSISLGEWTAFLDALNQALIAAARPAVVSDEVVLAMSDAYDSTLYLTPLKGRPAYIEAMRAALALLPGGVPDGWVLVPKEPTEAMVNAVWHHWLHGMGHSQECMRDALRAMLSASPKGSPRSLPSRTAQEPPSPTPCDLEGK